MAAPTFSISGKVVDILGKRIFPAAVSVQDGKIIDIQEASGSHENFILPGFVDAHIHVESSMLPPAEFARMAVVHGAVAAVADPHEIANVLGMAGIDFMLANAAAVPFTFLFGAPSCVPATPFETAGACFSAADIEELLTGKNLGFLGEMMNVPGVLRKDEEVMAKLSVARKLGKRIDGHAPGLIGAAAREYIAAGITTDHECSTIGEARAKAAAGMKILIREGSAAKNFDELVPLIAEYPDRVMFCSDDKHPDDLVRGHINELVKRALAKGYDFFDVLRCATLNPARHYGFDIGLLQKGDRADFVVADTLESLSIMQTFVAGVCCAENGRPLFPRTKTEPRNQFVARPQKEEAFQVRVGHGRLRVMEAIDGQLVTNELRLEPTVKHGRVIADPERDILKVAVLNRYEVSRPAVAFVKNFRLKRGAIASTVAHDSHNIIAVGADDASLCRAVNLLVAQKGGICAVEGGVEDFLPLPIAGLMSLCDGYEVAEAYAKIEARAKELGSTLTAPFMTLSFMALPVIPKLKLSDKGLFDAERFEFVRLFVD